MWKLKNKYFLAQLKETITFVFYLFLIIFYVNLNVNNVFNEYLIIERQRKYLKVIVKNCYSQLYFIQH